MSVESPCNKLCRLDPRTGVCEGCYRTAEEITRWWHASEDEQREILEAVARRRQAASQDPPG